MSELKVICYSGHTYAEEPRAFILDGREHSVERVVARWKAPNGPSFCVLSDLGPVILAYDENADRWQIAPALDPQDVTGMD